MDTSIKAFWPKQLKWRGAAEDSAALQDLFGETAANSVRIKKRLPDAAQSSH